MNRLTVILDDHVIARGMLSARSTTAGSEIARYWRRGVFELILTGRLVDEVARTLEHLHCSESRIMELVALLCERPECFVTLQHQRMRCLDPDDDHLFEAAVARGPSVLVSEDRHVLNPPHDLEVYLAERSVRVMTPGEFLSFIQARLFSSLALSAVSGGPTFVEAP